MTWMSWLTGSTAALSVAAVMACGGGGQSSAETSAAAPAAPPAPQAEPERQAAPESTTTYQIYWRDIHVLTAYPGSGSLRSEEPDDPDDVFSGECEYMSAISHFFEQEPDLKALIDQAHSLEEILALLGEDPDYDVEATVLEEGAGDQLRTR